MDGRETIKVLWRRVAWLEKQIATRKGPANYERNELFALRHCIELFDCMKEANIERAKELRRVRVMSEEQATAFGVEGDRL